ncbi:MAG TPA: hypothetical protein VLH37_06240 [Bacteroidales bacterium]|nr:hypothetical protein [Bacteroidales bacterium]
MSTLKTTFRICLKVALALIIPACSPKIIPALVHWQPASLNVAQGYDWMNPEEFDETTGIYYRISNDLENLYVFLQTENPASRVKILRAGMEIQIDTLGGNEAHSIVRFPLEENRITLFDGVPGIRPALHPTAQRDRQQRQDPVALFNDFMANQTHMAITGFKNHRIGRVPLDAQTGIQVNLSTDTAGVIFYRAIIPLETFYRTLDPGQKSTSPFTLNILIRGVETPGMMLIRDFGPGTSPDGRTMPPGTGGINQPGFGARPPMMRPPGTREMQELQRTRSFRIGFQLATQPAS